VIDWPWVVFGYLSFGSMALYLQHRYNSAAMDKLTAAHERNVLDLKMMIEVLQLALMNEQDAKQARLNSLTHADFAEGAVIE
jgi:hypothetical protein